MRRHLRLHKSFEALVDETSDLYEIRYRKLSQDEIEGNTTISKVINHDLESNEYAYERKSYIPNRVFNCVYMTLISIGLIFLLSCALSSITLKSMWLVWISIFLVGIFIASLGFAVWTEVAQIKAFKQNGLPKHNVYYLEDCSIEAVRKLFQYTLQFTAFSIDTAAQGVYIVARLGGRPMIINAEDCEEVVPLCHED